MNNFFTYIYMIFIVLCFLSSNVYSQDKNNFNPKKAAIYSSMVPGLGQFHTKKYWKIPIIYAGLITSGYYINQNYSNYKLYKDTYISRLNGDLSDDLQYNNDDLKILSTFYRRNTEISVLFFSLAYILNIIDASVSAHLLEYNINENLSMKINPIYHNSILHNNITLSIKF